MGIYLKTKSKSKNVDSGKQKYTKSAKNKNIYELKITFI